MKRCPSGNFENDAHLARFCRRIREKNADQKSCGPVVIVAFGDSVTMGSTANGMYIPEEVYHNRLRRMIAKEIPGAAAATLSVINSGIGGDTATAALQRIERDVIHYQPDLVLVAFAANDLGWEPELVQAFENSIRKIIRRIREKTAADVILITPTRMAGRENELASDKGYLDVLMQFQNKGVVAHYAEIIRKIGREEHAPVADVYAKWEQLEAEGVDTTAKLSNGLNHPTAEAHEISAKEIFDLIMAGLNHPDIQDKA